MNIISRKEAITKELKRYFTGKPCPKGHIAERTTKEGCCIQCRREYSKKITRERPQILRAYRKKYKELNPNYSKEYLQKNPDTNSKKYQNRKQRLKVKTSPFHKKDLLVKLHFQNNKCFYCKKDITDKWQTDHYIPLFHGGEHNLNNIVIVCPQCNKEKYNKMPDEFLKYREKIKEPLPINSKVFSARA